jgi:hypothetical protein
MILRVSTSVQKEVPQIDCDVWYVVILLLYASYDTVQYDTYMQ